MKSCVHKKCQQVNPQPESNFYVSKRKNKPPVLYAYCKKCFMKNYTDPRNRSEAKRRYAEKCEASKITVSSLPGELWKPVPGYNGRYEISSLGRIKSHYRGFYKLHATPINKVLGYRYTTFSVGGVSETLYLHRLIAEAFIPNPCNFPEVNHIDGRKANNTLSNLEWCTRKQNVHHTIHVLGKHATVNATRDARVRLALPDKWCGDCKEMRPKSEFHKNNNTVCGLYAYCRPCHRKRTREYDAKKRAEKKAANP